MKNPQVRITKGVMDVLKKEAKPFETPQEVLDRLLSKNPCHPSQAVAHAEAEPEIEEQQDEVMQDDKS